MVRFLEYLGLYLLVIIVQMLLFDNLHVSGYLNIVIYPIFLLLLPFDMKSIGVLLCSLLLGITADLCSDTLGSYTIVLLLLGYLRPLILRQISKIDFQNSPSMPLSGALGIWRFLIYSFFNVFIMFVGSIFLERLTFDYMLMVWVKIFISSFVTTIVIFFIQLPLNRLNRNLWI